MFWFYILSLCTSFTMRVNLLPPPRRFCFHRSLFVSRITQKQRSTNFHKIRWKGGTWATEKLLDFDGNLDHVTLGFGLR